MDISYMINKNNRFYSDEQWDRDPSSDSNASRPRKWPKSMRGEYNAGLTYGIIPHAIPNLVGGLRGKTFLDSCATGQLSHLRRKSELSKK